MCGACGSGRALPGWEDRLEPATRRVLAARAALANRLLDGNRLRVSAWGTGYVVSDGRGASTVAADLDTLWRGCARSGGQLVGWPGGTAEAEVELDPRLTAVPGLLAVWSAAVAHLARLPGPLRLSLPDPRHDGSLLLDLRPSAVRVHVASARTVVPSLAGPGATAAADHLSSAAPQTNR